MTGHGKCRTTPTSNYCSFETYLNSLKNTPGYWFLYSVQLPQDCKSFASEMAAGLIIAVSDGSYSSQYGTAAWVLQGTNSRCSGQVICPGSASDQNSYRSEVSGLLAILLFVDLLTKFFSITSGLIEVACDGESALNFFL